MGLTRAAGCGFVSPTGVGVALRVADDGPGVLEGEWAVVTGERERTQTDHASGLGLWLVRWLVEAYGGDPALEGSDMGGSAVVVSLGRGR